MKTIRAKCPNCWETDECVVENSTWSGQPKSQPDEKDSNEGMTRTGYNLRCPTCNMTFWYELRQDAS